MPRTETETKIWNECDRVVVAKAAKLNMTPGHMWTALELANDVERVSCGAVQGMVLRRVGQGSELRLHSMDATYYVRVLGRRLECVQEIYGEPPKGVYEGDATCVACWECARGVILGLESYEYEYDTQNSPLHPQLQPQPQAEVTSP